jgi:hypothetical protein
MQPKIVRSIGPDNAQTPFGTVGRCRDGAGLWHRGDLHTGNGMGETPSGETFLTKCDAADMGSIADVLIDDRIVLERLYCDRRTP